jgi:hypothetical protein
MPSHTRRSLAVLTAVAALALPAAAPAASPQPPNYPSAVPERPGALTSGHPRTPADLEPALAQERYYQSYGDPEPLTVAQSPTPSDDTPWLPIALSAAVALTIVAASTTKVRRLRIRRRATRVTT